MFLVKKSSNYRHFCKNIKELFVTGELFQIGKLHWFYRIRLSYKIYMLNKL